MQKNFDLQKEQLTPHWLVLLCIQEDNRDRIIGLIILKSAYLIILEIFQKIYKPAIFNNEELILGCGRLGCLEVHLKVKNCVFFQN